MPVYYDENEAIFDYLDELIHKTDYFCIDSYIYTSYIWEGNPSMTTAEEDDLLTDDQKGAYEEVLYEVAKRFPQLSDEDVELYLLEYIQTDEEDAEMGNWKDELRALLKAVQTSIDADQTPDISVILGGTSTSN